jgi:hypothetical protein
VPAPQSDDADDLGRREPQLLSCSQPLCARRQISARSES